MVSTSRSDLALKVGPLDVQRKINVPNRCLDKISDLRHFRGSLQGPGRHSLLSQESRVKGYPGLTRLLRGSLSSNAISSKTYSISSKEYDCSLWRRRAQFFKIVVHDFGGDRPKHGGASVAARTTRGRKWNGV